MVGAFTWRDGERLIRFGSGAATEAVDWLGGAGFLLLTTPRAAAQVPGVAAAAGATHHVAAGGVPELAATALREPRGDGRVVALGGGRVVDVAKAVVAARADGGRAMAIPTTLSGAEMTRGHRHAAGVGEDTPRVRCAVVVCDPAVAASQPEEDLAASAANALAHAYEGPCTTGSHPLAALAAHDAARRLASAFAAPGGPDRDELALGALLAGYTLDSTGFGLHHVMAQTLVRHGIAGHGTANALLLPHTTAALAWRFPEQHAALTAALGEDPAAVATRLCVRAGTPRLRDLGADEASLDACADTAAARPQLGRTPPRADRAELRMLYQAAW